MFFKVIASLVYMYYTQEWAQLLHTTDSVGTYLVKLYNAQYKWLLVL